METTKRGLPENLMLRVKACAVIFAAAKAAKIAEIAGTKGISLEDASIAYTIGALKRTKRQGRARTYCQALDQLESEQVGDRGDRITRSLSADTTAREVARINHINAGVKINDMIYDYDNVVVVDGKVERQAHLSPAGHEHQIEYKPCKVLGTLYTEWESKTQDLDPLRMVTSEYQQLSSLKDRQLVNDRIAQNLRLFFADYTSRLSKTAKQRLYELAQSDIDPHYLMGNGKTDPLVKRLAQGAHTLYRGFPHKEDVTGIEYISLVRQYVEPPVV